MAAEENVGSSPPPPSSPSTSYTSYPILVITLLGILTTAILLVSYYVFVIKCCMNWRPPRLSISRPRRRLRHWPPPSTVNAVGTVDRRGLGESAIRAIPTVRFRVGEKGTFDCAICLNEFEEEERLRILPGCAHTFHIDCIDTWLQTNDNCPVCRSDIASAEHVTIPPLFMAHFLHGQDTVPDVRADVFAYGGNSPRTELSVPPNLGEREEDPPPRKPAQRLLPQKKVGKLQHACSMGDECIDVREKDEEFHAPQPMRRSVSMDSSNDRKLYTAVQEMLRGQNPHLKGSEGSSGGGGGGSARLRRSFFSFGYGRSCRNAVLPIHFDP